jgi:hypothetical protein
MLPCDGINIDCQGRFDFLSQLASCAWRLNLAEPRSEFGSGRRYAGLLSWRREKY